MSPENEEQKDAPVKKSSSKKLLLILVVAILLLGGGGAGAYFMYFAAPKEEGEKVKEPEIIVKEMDTFIVNLSDPGGKRFLKVSMKARLDSQQAMAEFTARIFEMRDLVLTVLTGKEVEDIFRPEDKITLKQELATALNRSLKKGRVQDIYFTEFLIQ